MTKKVIIPGLELGSGLLAKYIPVDFDFWPVDLAHLLDILAS